jgi:hypothetical protein
LSGTNIYVVHIHAQCDQRPPRFVGVYSNKTLADAAGETALELYEPGKMSHSVTIAPLDDWVYKNES